MILVLALLVLAVWRFTRPRLMFRNALAVPVTLSVAGSEHLVPAGASVRIPLSPERPDAAL